MEQFGSFAEAIDIIWQMELNQAKAIEIYTCHKDERAKHQATVRRDTLMDARKAIQKAWDATEKAFSEYAKLNLLPDTEKREEEKAIHELGRCEPGAEKQEEV